jgi:hypothetical protein
MAKVLVDRLGRLSSQFESISRDNDVWAPGEGVKYERDGANWS